MFYVLLYVTYVHSSFATILMGKRELVAFLSLSSWCLVMVVWLILELTWVCLRFVIVVFPDHTYLLYLLYIEMLNNDTGASLVFLWDNVCTTSTNRSMSFLNSLKFCRTINRLSYPYQWDDIFFQFYER